VSQAPPAVRGADLTVEQLATTLGTKVSTIRLYQREGLLPPPEVRGRVAFYLPAHVARLRLIGRLQERGFSLAAIRALLDTWQRGGSLDDLVGVEPRRGRRAPPAPLTLSPAELTWLLGDDDRGIERAEGLGLAAQEADGTLRLSDRRFVRAGVDAMAISATLAALAEEYGYTPDMGRGIAERFLVLFGRRAFEPR
jgi:DNA-binding transcriptional MerR regulator